MADTREGRSNPYGAGPHEVQQFFRQQFDRQSAASHAAVTEAAAKKKLADNLRGEDRAPGTHAPPTAKLADRLDKTCPATHPADGPMGGRGPEGPAGAIGADGPVGPPGNPGSPSVGRLTHVAPVPGAKPVGYGFPPGMPYLMPLFAAVPTRAPQQQLPEPGQLMSLIGELVNDTLRAADGKDSVSYAIGKIRDGLVAKPALMATALQYLVDEAARKPFVRIQTLHPAPGGEMDAREYTIQQGEPGWSEVVAAVVKATEATLHPRTEADPGTSHPARDV